MGRIVTFLTDYGYSDEFAGACRLEIERLAPGTPVVDLTHGIAPGDVRRGALALEAAASRSGSAVHLAVVDPGVGGERRAVAIATADGSHVVAPDNGLASLAVAALGGATEAADISATPLRLDPVAPTFHGRDIFAPVAAHLAAGRPLAVAGEAIDPASLVTLELPRAGAQNGALVASVLYADGFGNLILGARPEEWEGGEPGQRLSVTAAGRTREAVSGRTFTAGEGGLVLYTDSSGWLALALDGGSAAELLGIGRDDDIRIEPA